MANKTESDAADEWGAQLDGKDAPAVGLNREMLRKALSLNPALKKHNTTTDIMEQLEKASSERKVVQSEEPSERRVVTDLVEGMVQVRDRYLDDKKRLRAEIAKLQAQEKELAPKALDRVLDMILQIDPNMTSVQTTTMLDMEKTFLNEVGFTPRKVIEKKLKKR